MILSDKDIRQLPQSVATYSRRTAVKGLQILVYPSGLKVFQYQRVIIGRFGMMSLDQAKGFATSTSTSTSTSTGNNIHTRQHPVKSKPKKRKNNNATVKTPITDLLIDQLFGHLIFSWLSSHSFSENPEKDQVARKRADSMIRCSLVSALGATPVGEIDHHQLRQLLTHLVQLGKRDGAMRCRTILITFFEHLQQRGIINQSPCHGLRAMNLTGKHALTG